MSEVKQTLEELLEEARQSRVIPTEAALLANTQPAIRVAKPWVKSKLEEEVCVQLNAQLLRALEEIRP